MLGAPSGPGAVSSGGMLASAYNDYAFSAEIGTISAPLQENNAFYVSSGVQTGLIVPLPASLQANGGVHYRWNGYRLDAQATGDPRSDRLFGWTLGLGRPLTSWSYLRVDYSRDRRTSSIPGLSTRTRSLLVTVGIDPTAVRR